jgi:hypothetical protein
MPVPRYVQKVAPTGLPGVNAAKQLAEPASAAPAVAQFSRQVYEMAEAEKRRADENAVQAAQTKAIQARNRMTYDPKTGLLTRKGQDALKAGEDLLPAYDKAMDDLEGELANESQIAMFRQVRDKEKLEFEDRVTAHTFKEVQQLEADEFQAGVGTKIDDGILNYRQPGKVQGTKLALRSDILARAEKMGWGADMTRQAMDAAVSQMHYGIVAREVTNGNYPEAENWYRQVKASKEVTGQDITRIEAMLKPAKAQHETRVQLEMVNAIADKYLLSYSDESVARQDMEAEYKDQPFLREAQAEFSRRFKERENQDQFATTDKAHRELEAAMAGRPVDPVTMSALPAKTRKKILEYAEGASRWGAANISASGDAHIYLLKLAAEKPDTFMRTQLIDYGLEPDLLKEMRNLQLGMRNKDAKAQEELHGIVSQQERIDMAGRQLGFRPQDKASWDAFTNLANKGIIEFQRRERRKMTDKEYQEYMDALTIRVKTDKSLLNL